MSIENKAKAAADQVKAKETVGAAVDDDATESEGVIDQAKGKIEEGVEKFKDTAKNVTDS